MPQITVAEDFLDLKSKLFKTTQKNFNAASNFGIVEIGTFEDRDDRRLTAF